MTEPEYVVSKARYAQNMMAVHCRSDGSGLKTRAMCLAAYFSNSRYSGREHAYIMSQAASRKFEAHYAEGWDASYMERRLMAPRKE